MLMVTDMMVTGKKVKGKAKVIPHIYPKVLFTLLQAESMMEIGKMTEKQGKVRRD